jgi:hypothetical protein
MSCITELLKMKGDKKYLFHPDNTPYNGIAIENGGTFKNYEYLITFTGTGTRCGYVAIPENNAKKINENNFRVHGGITFFENSHPFKDLLPIKCTDFWLGFDAGHGWDLKDTKLLKKLFPDSYVLDIPKFFFRGGEKVRSCAYMVNECRKLINQIIKVKFNENN